MSFTEIVHTVTGALAELMLSVVAGVSWAFDTLGLSPIEIIGVVVSALAIWLTARRKMLCWPVGLVSVAVYGWIFYDAKLYSDMLLQGAFAIMQAYGWWHWLTSGHIAGAKTATTDPIVRVQPITWRGIWPGLLAGAIGSVVVGGLMSRFTDAALPWVDASLSSFSLVAQYWTARKYLASWGLWTIVDCIYVGMFTFKALYPTSLLYAFFVVLAVIGWRDWQQALKAQQTDDGADADSFGNANGVRLAGAFGAGNSGSGRRAKRQGGTVSAALSAVPGSSSPSPVVQFGISGEQAERDWPLMIVSEVASVLASYRIAGTIERLSWHSPRPFAAAALATMTTGETLFVKRHHISLRDVEALNEEHRFIAHLYARGIPVVQVLPDRLGRTAITIGDWTYELHKTADGEDVYRNVMSWEPFKRAAHAYAAGEALARLHLAAADYDAPARPPRLLLSSFRVLGAHDLIGALETWIQQQPALVKAFANRPWRRDIAAVIGPYHARLAPLLPTLRPLWTHGDWHASNLLWSGAGDQAEVTSVLDFGLADRTCAVYDLALAIERNAIEWLAEPAQRIVHIDQIDALLDGYAAEAPLDANDYAALIALLPIVHMEFALSEVGYFASVLDLPEAADIAYNGYLLGHVHWFEQPAGRAVLMHLIDRSEALGIDDPVPGPKRAIAS